MTVMSDPRHRLRQPAAVRLPLGQDTGVLLPTLRSAVPAKEDVVPTAEVLAYFDRLPAGLFDLPAGDGSTAPGIKEAAE